MTSSDSLVNFAPIINIVLMGLIVAMGPLSWVWLKTRNSATLNQKNRNLLNPQAQQLISRQRLLMLSQITLFLTFDLLVFGAFTRLTDSGLGCPDWPGCYGHGSPSGASSMIASAQALMPTGPVTHVKAWIEMIHRYLATGVGVLILTIALFTGTQKYLKSLMLDGALILLWVCLQGAFGALTVTMKLFPLIVTLHLMGAVILLILLTRFVMTQRNAMLKYITALGSPSALYQQGADTKDVHLDDEHSKHIDNVAHELSRFTQLPGDNSRSVNFLLTTGLLLALLQILMGGWVSTNYAVTACTTFPMCQNSWWPLMNFSEGFELWRPLGLTSAGANINFESLTAIHYSHRLMAYVLFGFMCLLGYVLRKQAHYKTLGKLIWVLITLQVITGVSNVIFQWPLLAAVLHTGGAAALVIVLTLGLKMRRVNPSTDMHFGQVTDSIAIQNSDSTKGVL